ncbi:MAG: hypothetical protein MZV70_76560 [Desulfobacterales bacterium]|nr:hypothetical protein [Desulfobacterales bacterium]
MAESFSNLTLDFNQWHLPHFIGVVFDSESEFLLLLQNIKYLKCFTWGLKSALKDEYSDAVIAKKICAELNLEHKYFEIDLTDESIEKVLNRFIIASEGRIDHISGYTDGLNLWKIYLKEKFLELCEGMKPLVGLMNGQPQQARLE